jgi:hypothetical protein
MEYQLSFNGIFSLNLFMNESQNLDNPIKFKPDYVWPEKGTERNCPRCETPLQLNENRRDYYGKPWWCGPCQWQFSEDDFS